MATRNISLIDPSIASLITVSRRVSFGDTEGVFEVEAEYLDKTKAEVEDFAEACMKQGQISLAMQASALACADNDPPPENAVYVVSSKGASFSKIGFARGNPTSRLKDLQVGNWNKLYVHALFWLVEGSAMGVEQLSHRVARKMGKAVRGEWFEINPHAATYIVASVAHSANVKVADSGMWLRLREAMRHHRAKAYHNATLGSRYNSIGRSLDLSGT